MLGWAVGCEVRGGGLGLICWVGREGMVILGGDMGGGGYGDGG